ncbi:hypothetical protein AL065_07245 [Pseudomonas amygdali pv. ulmi]|uniref:hypothetical protein n=1 Tax=Pseudomonas amygdali TaxID=47877 RepID=UPI00070B5303|nr:hypothetical protein [Pseudomonas amygdali]KWS09532.1 hypothetical protein AL065_07245 [Pseudomonas amygdali pv. ulmi]
MRSSTNVKVPPKVMDALLVDFGVAITGYINEPEIVDFSLVGRIYFDHKDRFLNGRLIRTSDVSEFVERCGFLLAITLTQSIYVLICPNSDLLGLPKCDESAHSTKC